MHVTHEDALAYANWAGKELPTEAQWEDGARGGTTTPWWTGLDPKALSNAANLADQFLKENGAYSGMSFVPWSDGYGVHSPVGALTPNPFGLHDVLGNVCEWCRDRRGPYSVEPAPGDGYRLGEIECVTRGANFTDEKLGCRSSRRSFRARSTTDCGIGIRPCRPLVP